jgi:hypothetical protein
MISKIYNTNNILFQSGQRKGQTKKDIQELIDKKSCKGKGKTPKKVKHLKPVVDSKRQLEAKMEKKRLESLKRNPHLEIVDGKLVPKKEE